MTTPGSLTRYAATRKASVTATLREEVAADPDAGRRWRDTLLEHADYADDMARSCKEDAKMWDARGRKGYGDYLRSEADRHTERADDYRMRASWVRS